MKAKNGFIVREIAGQSVIMALGAENKDFNKMIKVNDTGRFIWDCLSEETSVDAIIAKMCAEYDAPEELIRRDVEAFTKQLLEIGAVHP